MEIIEGLIAGAGIIIALIVAAAIWEFGRRVWYWIAARVMGWNEQEKFMRETEWIDREASRAQRQHTKDVTADSSDRRRLGAYFVTLAIAMVAWRLNLPWWEIAIMAALSYVGSHMIAGVTIKWWG